MLRRVLVVEDVGAERVGTQDFHVVSAVKGGGIGYGFVAHAPAHLLDGVVFVFIEPTIQFRQDMCGVMHTIAQQRRSHKRDLCTSQNGFDQVARTMNATGDSQVGADMAAEDGCPVQAEKQLFRTA